MQLEDLVLKRFRVEKCLDGIYPARFKIVATQDSNGNYKADSAERLERALNTSQSIRKTDNIFVKIGSWHTMSRCR